MLLGLFRGELAVLLWGGFFASLCLYILIARFIFLGRTKIFNRAWTFEAVLPLVEHGQFAHFLWKSNSLTGAPLFKWKIRGKSVNSKFRNIDFTTDWIAGEVRFPVLRGDYQIQWSIELLDRFHLTRWRKSLEQETRLLVYPSKGFPFPLPESSAQEGQDSVSHFMKDGELPLDERPYMPGDDIRKVNWNLWAHTGNPYIKVQAAEPALTGKAVFILDTSVPAIEGLDGEPWLDLRVQVLLALLSDAMERKIPWILILPSGLNLEFNGEDDSTEFQSKLRGLLAMMDPVTPDPLSYKIIPGSLYLVSGPGCPGAALINQVLQQSQRDFVPLTIPAPVKKEEKKLSWWLRPNKPLRRKAL